MLISAGDVVEQAAAEEEAGLMARNHQATAVDHQGRALGTPAST
jgi:hypothetical protein